MPFIPKPERATLNQGEPAFSPGQRCFLEYQWMVTEWKADPRWTTADRIYEAVQEQYEAKEFQRAKELAWQVFFQFYVLPYEMKKRWENGEI